MHRLILALATFIFCSLWVEVKVEKVLKTTNTEEYNQWVAKNKEKLPCLRPILVDVEPYDIKDIKDTVNVEHKIYYYSESGKLLKKEVIRESDVYFAIPKTTDRIYILKSRYKEGVEYRKIKNAKGETIPAPQISTAEYIGMGLYVESDICETIPQEGDVKILDENGNEIGVIKHLAGIDGSQLYIACDERYAVFRGIIANETPIICINKTGAIVWRKDFEPSPDYLYISANGTRIGVHHRNFITVLNEDGSLVNTFTPFGQERVFKCGLSPNGNFLVFSNISKYPKIIFYDLSKGKALWCDDSTLVKNKDLVKYLHIDINNRVIALCESHNLYIFSKNGKLEYKKNLDLGKEFRSVPAERKNGIVYSKKVEVLAQNWFTELSGQYLIITQGRGSVTDVYRKVQRRIVYKIVTTSKNSEVKSLHFTL
ncbi:MAG: hypothetical protein ACUVTF_10295 [bacterium]